MEQLQEKITIILYYLVQSVIAPTKVKIKIVSLELWVWSCLLLWVDMDVLNNLIQIILIFYLKKTVCLVYSWKFTENNKYKFPIFLNMSHVR